MTFIKRKYIESDLGFGLGWEQKSFGCNTGSFFGVAYGRGLFVAIGGGFAYTSKDGINWISHSFPSGAAWPAIAFGNGMFVAASNSVEGNSISYSFNGEDWVRCNTPYIGPIENAVAYGNGRWIVLARGGQGFTSIDGINWTQFDSGINAEWIGVCFGNGIWAALSYTEDSGVRIMTSIDGLAWSAATTPAALGAGYDICFGAGRFVAVGSGEPWMEPGVIGLTSTDGITWEAIYGPITNRWEGVCWGGGMFACVASPIGAHNPITQSIMISFDGINWELRSHLGPEEWQHWQKVCYGNGMFVAVTYDGTNHVMTSGAVEKIIEQDQSYREKPRAEFEQLSYTDTTNKVIGPLAAAPNGSKIMLLPFGSTAQELGVAFTVRYVGGGTMDGSYICIDPASTAPGGGSFWSGANPSTGISLISGNVVQLAYSVT